ncbi:DUF5666 domain-containing protein [Lichenifustis flavocetrariae]|uniref:DUF5666 domain-containing protein n=1 Tax=Lichenifustis flavocetrariae TaxID=2949735 RepID=A0AA42CGA9_9HYPH|nr:DUF5666 domain-containing protein [Lichenifustis flavocetrariae]MCW6506408.1 DUF5666 domain-containing protein [Lichenifustis flavocetrariae]
MIRNMTLTLAAILSMSTTIALAQSTTRIRGTVVSLDGNTLHVTPNGGGVEEAIALSPKGTVIALVPAKLSDITAGSFIGTAATTQPDGSLVAKEVHIFPESMRGAGEGHREFDLGPKSTMTNGTVGQEVRSTAGNTLTVTYKGGEKSIVVPPDAPVVMFAPGDKAMLVPGAHVQLQARKGDDGTLTAERVTVGKDGLVPPM